MLPILTLNNLLTYDNTLFDLISLPDGVDGQLLVDTLARNYGEMQVLYPDWSIFRYYANSWFASHERQIADLYRVYVIDYNPIWNKDGTIEETRTPNITRTLGGSDTTNVDSTRTPNLTNEIEYDSGESTDYTGDTTEKVKGFNSTAFNDLNQDVPNTNTDTTRTGTDTTTQTGTDTVDTDTTVTYGRTDSETGTETTIRRETGNIGVTQTQEMVLAEVRLKRSYSFYDLVAKMFATDFCVMIY